MLAQRILTALVLLAFLLPAIFLAPAVVWGGVSLFVLAMAAVEWGRLLGSARAGWGLGLMLCAAGFVYLVARMQAPQALGLSFGVLALMLASLAYWLTIGLVGVIRAKRLGSSWIGAVLLLSCAWVALFELRMRGTLPLVSAMVIVWLADIGAYAFGRLIGRHKLAPRVSPGKTWEGAMGGVLVVWAFSAGVYFWAPAGCTDLTSANSVLSCGLIDRMGWMGAGLVLSGLVALSILGDLHESLLKREAGVKDSGTVLPGHGGILDRIDALIPAMPGCLLVYLLLG